MTGVESAIRVEPIRLRGGRRSGRPHGCDMPTCRAPLRGWLRVRVRQAGRRWAFCSPSCAAGYVRLCEAADAAADEGLA